MGNVTEITEESKVLLEIIEPIGGQIEIIDNDSTQLEIIESGSSLNPTTLDITPEINTIIVDSVNENINIDILSNDSTTVETSITDNVIEIVESQVVYQTGSIFNNNYFPVTESITNITQNITQSVTQSTTIVNSEEFIVQAAGDQPGILIQSGGIFQNVTQSGNDFTEPQIIALKNLIFNEGSIALSNNAPSNPEKFISRSVTFTYSVNLNDDILSTATFDGVDVTSNPNGSQTFPESVVLGDTTFTKTFSVIFSATETSDARSVSKSDPKVTFRDPQYLGVSTIEDFHNKSYSEINSALTKKLQSGTGMNQTVSPTDQYVYFLTKNSDATITDGNGFNNTSDFNKTTITVEYINGNSQTLTQYRTKDTKTLTSFRYNIT